MNDFLDMIMTSSGLESEEKSEVLSNKKDCWDWLVSLAQKINNIDLIVYETENNRTLIEKLVPILTKNINAGFEFFEFLKEEMDGKLTAFCPPERREEISDIIYFAHLELDSLTMRMKSFTDEDEHWSLLETANAVLQKLRRIYVAIDLIFAESKKEKVRLEELSEHHKSRLTRQAYATLGNKIRRFKDPILIARLRLISNGLAKLIGQDVYIHCKLDDRKVFRDIQKRLADIIGRDNEVHETEMKHLLEDIDSIFDLMIQVNSRVILQSFDELSIDNLLNKFASTNEVSESELLTIYGKSSSLDDHIDKCEILPTEKIVEILMGFRTLNKEKNQGK